LVKTAGKNFEDEVANLLELANFNVKHEMLLGHKKVDLYITEQRFGSVRRIAVECKSSSRSLTQAQVSYIYSNYRPLIDANLIDEVLVVTKNCLTPSALAMVDATRDIAHIASADLFNLVMDFGPYLVGLQAQFHENGLSSYYVPPLDNNRQDLEKLLLDWWGLPTSQPIAILGSYGTGKTTLARRMAHILASKALRNREERIPILVRLGEISSEQSLEGLLGKLFTARSVVRNYSFDVFMALNSMGRFVVFLDGFDEMKHTLSWPEFKYNFRQLNRLVTGNSKVVILGRPTAFLNDDEYRNVLHGIRNLAGVELREPDWPEYKEVHLSAFSESQARIFLRRYLEYKIQSVANIKERKKIRHVIDYQVDIICGKDFPDLSRRPVQLKMLAEVLPTWKGEVEELTVSNLYSYFIDLIIEREQEKLGRQRFGTGARRSFARDLAMFLWKNKGEMSITADSIPAEILWSYRENGEDLEAVRRDLVSACFLDRKLGDSLFFPHRSFQEFLVAEDLVINLTQGRIAFSDASLLTNNEIAEFIEGMINLDKIKSWEERLERAAGTMSSRFAQIWLSQKNAVGYLWNRFERVKSPWYPALLTLAVKTEKADASFAAGLINNLLERLSGPVGRYGLVCLWCLLEISSEGDRWRVLKQALGVETYKTQDHRRSRFEPENGMIRFMSGVLVDTQEKVAYLGDAYRDLFYALSSYCLIADRSERGETESIDSFKVGLPMKIELPTLADADELQDFQYKYCGLKKIPDRRRRE
jgi:hypothetical protein